MSDKPKKSVGSMIRNAVRTMRENFMSRLLDQKRDFEQEFGHPADLSSVDYWKKFDRGDVAARIISIFPEECFKSPPLIYEQEDEEETEFEKEVDLLEDELSISSFLLRADTLSGVGRFGVILLGLDDGLSLEQSVAGFISSVPVKPVNNATDVPALAKPAAKPKRRLLYLRTFDESLVTIDRLENDPTNARFGQPVMYEITFWTENINSSLESSSVPSPSGFNTTNPQSASTRTTFKVHWTRIIHLADNRLRDEIYGTPRLKKVFDRILDLHKIAGGSAEMFWKGAFPGLSLEQHPSDDPIVMTDEEKEATKDELEQYYEGLKRYITLQGMTANSLAPQAADPGPHADLQIKLIAMAIPCPWRVFMGSEMGQLASGQDMVEWNARLERRRKNYLDPFVIRPFFNRLIELGVLPFPQGGKGNTDEKAGGENRAPRPVYIIYWPSLYTPSKLEQADVAVKQTDAMSKYIAGGVDTLIPPATYLEVVLGFSKDEVEAMLEEVGDRLIETDPEAEAEQAAADAEIAHQRSLEKIEVAAKAGNGNGNGFPARK